MISIRTPGGEETIPVEEFEQRVRAGRVHPTTPVCFPVLTQDRWVEARELELYQKLYVPARVDFSRAFTLGRFPIVTFLLCLAQLLVFLRVSGGERSVSVDALVAAGAKWRPLVIELGETWRLLSANVLHRDVLHLFFNLFFLFNLGGTIENAYRVRDYVLVLVVAGLATTTLSTVMSPLPSVGASGMVLGLFGAASVFGYKYGEILPARYRRYFGGAVFPYALFILYVGLATEDTDNWGHLGGLVGGALATMPLTPRLLVAERNLSFGRRAGPILGAAGLVVAVLGLGPVLRAAEPTWVEIVDPASGLSAVRPARWRFGENHLGDPAWGNRLGASIGVRAERRASQPFELTALKALFLEEELPGRERDGEVANVRFVFERPLLVEGGRGVELFLALETRAGPMSNRTLLIERGYHAYRITFTAPRTRAAAYAPLFDRMRAQVRLTEPAALVAARAHAEVFSGMSSAYVELGHQLANIGAVQEAREAYLRALEQLPEHPDGQLGLAKLAYDYGGDLSRAEAMAADLWSRRGDDATFAALYADILRRLGQTARACGVVQRTLDRRADPADALRERLTSWRCRGGGEP